MLPPEVPPVRWISRTFAPATAFTDDAGMVNSRVRFQFTPIAVPTGWPFMVTEMSCVAKPGVAEPPQIRSTDTFSRAVADACAADSMKWIRLRWSVEDML